MSKGNEPAFPHFTYDVVRTSKDRNGNDLIQPIYVAEGGLTKREYFAAMAMQGLVSNPDVKPNYQASFVDAERVSSVNESYARIALGLADALLAELEKERS